MNNKPKVKTVSFETVTRLFSDLGAPQPEKVGAVWFVNAEAFATWDESSSAKPGEQS